MGCKACGGKVPDQDKIDFVSMLKSAPNWKKFSGDTTRRNNLSNAWRNDEFGGSVLQPLGGLPSGKRSRTNVLDQFINKA